MYLENVLDLQMRKVPDKSFLNISKKERYTDHRYKEGINAFLDFAFSNPNLSETGEITCPCRKCRNRNKMEREKVYEHLVWFHFHDNYIFWDYHGESRIVEDLSSTEPEGVPDRGRVDAMDVMLQDLLIPGEENNDSAKYVEEVIDYEDLDRIMKLVEANEQDLYEGCTEFSRLSFMVRLFHIQSLSGMANNHFEMLLDLLRRVIPKGEDSIPKTHYEAKKIVKTLGLDYRRIDACPNDCILYYKDNKDLDECPKCKAPRWKPSKRSSVVSTSNEMTEHRKIPAKVLRHFPLIPRLQRFFITKDIAKKMRWHSEGRVNDEKLRHPADAEAWKHLDRIYPEFGNEARNVRLGLASDGFNPFGTMSLSWSTWPVLLMPYNLPPWMCMKQPYNILSLLIPGKHSPGNDIDVYLEPLIDELKLLWDDGVKTYDAHSKQNFKMRAAVLWTINDFPAYANLSGWSTKGTYACPVCATDYPGTSLKASGKLCYWGHRRWLPANHPSRSMKAKFNGEMEFKGPPKRMSGSEIVQQLSLYHNVKFGKNRYGTDGKLILKKDTKRKRKNKANEVNETVELPKGWSKISIFFRLPYWEHLKIRHNLDVMHVEKNICDNILGTFLQDPKKSKDGLKARQDLTKLGIRMNLQAVDVGNNKFTYAASRVTMSKEEMIRFCEVLKSVKLPDGYASNISSNVQVQERKILNLKTHDCHILLHQLIPVALRKNIDPQVAKVLIEFCGFFNQLCSKVIDTTAFEKLETQIVETLCKMEVLFQPSFFTIMVHLTVHLAYEARIAGPVMYRWMYPIERYNNFFIILLGR